ncbi:hypothetical protein [Metabacillus sp. cB07]|uniref:YkvI family membrane protein n=1 Tax=Metabacillus sp. cB07 TaxID=2806989 RepID=UPI00193AB12E|nr:hypothetical protein [Metabacillus sp. cB07]
MKKQWFQVVQIAAVYVGTVVGAGFATGREIVEFFTQYGVYGMFGILLCGYFFMHLGSKIMIISKRIGANSYQDLNFFLFGKSCGTVVNLFMLVVLFGVTSVMLSGAGAIFEEQLNLSSRFGVMLTIALTLIAMSFGSKGLFSVNIIVVPMLILFSVLVAASSFDAHSAKSLMSGHSSFKWIISAVSYAAFNLAMAEAVLVPLAKEIEDERTAKWGGIAGGAILTFILLSSHFALSSLRDVISYDIPMAEVMKASVFSFFIIYILVIYGEVFTSVIGNLFGLERHLVSVVPLPGMLIIALLLCGAFFISLIDYSSLIAVLYPVFGYMSLIFLLLLMVRKAPPSGNENKF